MGLSVSAAVAILFSAFLIMSGVYLGAIFEANQHIMDAQETDLDLQNERSCTSISIEEVDTVNDTITVMNEGSVELDLELIDLLIDGVYSTNLISQVSIDGVTTTSIWTPMESLTIYLSTDIESQRVKVIAGNGVSAYMG